MNYAFSWVLMQTRAVSQPVPKAQMLSLSEMFELFCPN